MGIPYCGVTVHPCVDVPVAEGGAAGVAGFLVLFSCSRFAMAASSSGSPVLGTVVGRIAAGGATGGGAVVCCRDNARARFRVCVNSSGVNVVQSRCGNSSCAAWFISRCAVAASIGTAGVVVADDAVGMETG